MTDEQQQVVGAFINETLSMRNRFANYIEMYELYPHLTREEVEFMNAIAIACQSYIDSTNLKRPLSIAEKEELS